MHTKRNWLYALIVSFMLSPVALRGFLGDVRAYDVAYDAGQGSFWDLFDFFSSKEREAFESLCDLAGISINGNFDALNALKFVEMTQKLFLNRCDKQERWERSPLQWISDNEDDVRRSLLNLGIYDVILPKFEEYDAVCILGAAGPTMQARIDFVEKLFERGLKTKYVILLTGERYVTDKIDGSSENLLKVAQYFGLPLQKLTETHLFRYIYENSRLKGKAELVVIDTAQKDGRRPTTQTTVEDFLRWRSNNPLVKKVLFVSNQPSVKYQNAVIMNVISYHKSDLDFETVGEGYKKFDLQRGVGEVGAYIWAVMPQIFANGEFAFGDEAASLAKKLYSHQPLFYANLFNK